MCAYIVCFTLSLSLSFLCTVYIYIYKHTALASSASSVVAVREAGERHTQQREKPTHTHIKEEKVGGKEKPVIWLQRRRDGRHELFINSRYTHARMRRIAAYIKEENEEDNEEDNEEEEDIR